MMINLHAGIEKVYDNKGQKRKSTSKLNVQIPHTEWKSPLLAVRFLYLGLAMRDGGLIRLFVLHY